MKSSFPRKLILAVAFCSLLILLPALCLASEIGFFPEEPGRYCANFGGSADVVYAAGRETESVLMAQIEEGLGVQATDESAGAQESSSVEEIEDPFAEEYEEEYEEEYAEEEMPDPFEPFNRAMFTFNDRMYFWVLKPTLEVYVKLVPEWGRRGIDNFFRNIMTPISFVSNLLQLRFHAAATDLARFVLNSTLGVGGLVDFAGKHAGLERTDEDIGQALGRYGLGHGFYIVWPVLGPSSLRDTIGMVGDVFLNPMNYLEDEEVVIGLNAGYLYNDASLRLGDYEDLKEAAIDPYVALRDAYQQYREDQVRK